MPDKPSCITAFGLYKNELSTRFGVSGEELNELYKKYYDYLLEHKISAYNLPYDILDERVDIYLSDPRVTTFLVSSTATPDKLTAYYKKLSSNPVWFDKAMFYPVDEPDEYSIAYKYTPACEKIALSFPGFKVVMPLNDLKDMGDGMTRFEYMRSVAQNVWCVQSTKMTGYGIQNMIDFYADAQARGEKTMWYVCCQPKQPYCNIMTDFTGLQHRVLFWQQRYIGAEGLLYWCVNKWVNTEDPWTDAITRLGDYGDGNLFYNGNKVGINGPVGSVRLEAVRDGIEDFEYLTMAKSLLTLNDYNALIESVICPNKGSDFDLDKILFQYYTQSDEDFAAARITLGNALEAATK